VGKGVEEEVDALVDVDAAVDVDNLLEVEVEALVVVVTVLIRLDDVEIPQFPKMGLQLVPQ